MRTKPLSTLLRFLNLFASAVLSGGLIMTVAALRPGLAGLPLSAAVPAQQLVVQRATSYMPVCGAFAALSAVFLIKRRAVTKEAARFYRVGLICMIFTGLSSIYVGAVLDKEIRGWRVYILAAGRTAGVSLADPDAPAGHRLLVWNRWGAVNAARTVASAMALVCFIMANVQPRVLAPDA